MRIYSEYRGIEFGVEKCALLIMKSSKRQMIRGMEPNQEKIRTLGGKETCKYLNILEANTIKHAEMKEKRIPQENEEATRNQTTSQKSYHKILEAILKVDERKASTNGPEKNKTNDGT